MRFAIVISLFLLGGAFGFSSGKAVRGFVDLRGWDLQQRGPLDLDGEWEFAWRQLLLPTVPFPAESLRSHDGAPAYSGVPLRWNVLDNTHGNALPAFGAATYRLRVALPPHSSPLALLLNSQASSAQLWVNGKFAGGTGTVALDATAVSPRLGHVLYEIPEGVDSLEIRVLVANFAQHRGGFLRPLRLGLASDIQQAEALDHAVRFFLSGGLLLMALYHLILFLSRRKDRIHFYFTGIAAVAITRILIPGDHLLQTLVPVLGFEAIVRIEYLSLLVIIAFIATFLHEFFPSRMPVKLVHCFWGAAAGFGLFALIAPLPLVTAGQVVTQVINLLGGIVLLAFTTRALLAGDRGAGLILATLLLLFGAVINDILHARNAIHTTYLSSYAIFILVFVQWALIAERYSKTFHMLFVQREQFLRAMSVAIESKDPYTGGHVERVARFSRDLALALGWSADEAYELYLAAMVHDVGKIGVRDSILNKPGRFEPDELDAMQKHPGIGYQMLADLEGSSLAAQISLHHQQRWNGSGYTGLEDHPPLRGELIPIAPRIVAVADYWDAISSDRPYRKAMPLERSIALLIDECGVGLDPELVRLFLQQNIWRRYLQHPPTHAQAAAAEDLVHGKWPDASENTGALACGI